MQLQRAREVLLQKPQLTKELTNLFQWIRNTPQANTVKGMYVAGIVKALELNGVTYVPPTRVQPFKDYPLNTFMELLVDSAITIYPDTSVHDGLFRLGQLAIPTFAKSIVGKVFMSTGGRSWELALKYISRGYEISLKPGKATVIEMGAATALVSLRGVWNFGDSYQVGVMDGLMKWFDLRGKITPHVISQCDVDLRIEWQVERTAHRSRSRPPPAHVSPRPWPLQRLRRGHPRRGERLARQ